MEHIPATKAKPIPNTPHIFLIKDIPTAHTINHIERKCQLLNTPQRLHILNISKQKKN